MKPLFEMYHSVSTHSRLKAAGDKGGHDYESE